MSPPPRRWSRRSDSKGASAPILLEQMMTDLDLYKITLSLFDREITQVDLDSDTPSREVRLCKLYKDLAQVRAMREFDWSFLVVKLQMDYENDEPGRGFQHGYILPQGLMKVVRTYTKYKYEVAEGRLYTDVAEADVYGIMTDLPEANVPEDFYELIAYALAYQIAPMLAPEGRMEKVILQKYTWALNGLMVAECYNNSLEE